MLEHEHDLVVMSKHRKKNKPANSAGVWGAASLDDSQRTVMTQMVNQRPVMYSHRNTAKALISVFDERLKHGLNAQI
jgi:hypothetical protein